MPESGAIESLLREDRVFRPLPKLVLDANINPGELAAAFERAASDPLGYWEGAALELDWFSRWERVLDDSQAPYHRWFPGGTCNIVHNALDRHITTANKNKLALIWEGEPGDTRKYTYYELYREVNRFASALRSLGVGKGDRVVVYMPPLPEQVVAMLACAKIGAIHSVVFAGFSGRALRDRIRDTQAKCIVTADGFYRNGQVVGLKSRVDAALADETLDFVDIVVVVRRTGADGGLDPSRDVSYEDVVRMERPEAHTEVMEASDPLFLLYTSGATGKPKGIVHAHGGYMVGVHRTLDWVFDIKPTDIFWCTADAGWITGHSYVVYGPLLAGTTTMMYEGHPLYPQADRIWRIIEQFGVTVHYTTPTLIRMLRRYGDRFPRARDLSTLRLLGTVGEPISPETWMWYHQTIGGGTCPIMDTWWQTETGHVMLSPLPVSPLKPGSVGKPLPGVEFEVVDPEGEPVERGKGGHLTLAGPWPGMLKNVWNDPEAYQAYWKDGRFLTGDVARVDEDGYIWMQGRADEVLNIAGHRIGTAELESALVSHRDVAEGAVIPVADKIKGEAAKAFVVLADEVQPSDELAEDIKAHVTRELGPVAVVKTVRFRETLPKTNSGKILRRVLRAEEAGQDPGDLSTAIEEE
ncbi:acetate--CoA ligase [Desulfohalovibrio reitneri]|uniref:acetate--CoA ligase n=1 Tax=Desulfohalovibrio reitneri TaxID=1307759 RepID=UPI0004A72F94|nr:acetate--CoA ligase [Desulfohalovibrio reitneri]